MRKPVHFNHTMLLMLDCGLSEHQTLAVAQANQMTDWATPGNLGPDYWPAATGILPGVTQVDEAYGIRSVLGSAWNPAWPICHNRHFGGGSGSYGLNEYQGALCDIGIQYQRRDWIALGLAVHLAQDYASHKGYCGWPDERNRHLGDGRSWWSRIADRCVGRNELLGHWLRPEVDCLEVSRASLIPVSSGIIEAITGSQVQPCRSIGLLLDARDDADLERRCNIEWHRRTGKDMPEFEPYSPMSADWAHWCEVTR
jgi:hypothetical protein